MKRSRKMRGKWKKWKKPKNGSKLTIDFFLFSEVKAKTKYTKYTRGQIVYTYTKVTQLQQFFFFISYKKSVKISIGGIIFENFAFELGWNFAQNVSI